MTERELRAKWIEALRSGKYEQGQYNLCYKGKHCCLGVLCEVYQKNIGGLEINRFSDTNVFYNDQSAVLPSEVAEAVGLDSNTGTFLNEKNFPVSLLAWNDTYRKTFSEIADLIESNPKELFHD